MKNRILILYEKNWGRYFYIPADEDLHRVALKIVLERYESGNWYYFEPESKLDKYQSDLLSNIIKNNDGKIALKFLKLRQYYEYEGLAIEDCENF